MSPGANIKRPGGLDGAPGKTTLDKRRVPPCRVIVKNYLDFHAWQKRFINQFHWPRQEGGTHGNR